MTCPASLRRSPSAGPIGLGLMRLIYRGRFHEVMAVGDAHFQFDVRRWMQVRHVRLDRADLCVRRTSRACGSAATSSFACDGIHERSVWSRPGRFVHPYRDVASLLAVDGQKLANNMVLPDRRFLVIFRNGTSVPSPQFAYADGRPEVFEPLHYTSHRSGVPIQWVPAEFP